MEFLRQRLAPCNNLSSNGPFLAMASNSNTPGLVQSSTPAGDLSEELWQACAGSLAYVPRVDERVWYFPQGHMEQVTASTQQESSQKLPKSGLSSRVLCRVINRSLSAEADTDEVYAQISLVPEPEERLEMLFEKSKQEEASSQPQPKSSTRLFIKILTASDTSTHGGFSVLRKHAEECLPPLDMTQETPSQELKAKDLHGYEWKFRHTYRGHPRRHLLTTGWSLFVSQKKLLAGDAVIFLRGENGELRVGIRRAKRPQSAPQSVMSSQSMHMGVIATAIHAIGTRTMFSVFFKPRMSSSSFLVPLDKFSKAMSVSLSVGMRFKMQFETEDASERSFTGTITGIEDLNAENWADSKWRSLKVDWDEINHERPNRVSPWEIELATSSPLVTNTPLTPVRNKRQRPLPLTSPQVTDLSGPGSSRVSLDSTISFKRQIVLQGQECQDMGMSPLWKSPPIQHNQGKHPPHHLVQFQQPQHHQDGGMSSFSISRPPFGLFPPPEIELKTPFKGGVFPPAEAELKTPFTPSPTLHGGQLSRSHSLQFDHQAGWPAPSSDASLSRLLSSRPPFFSSSMHSQQESLHVEGNCPSSVPVQAATPARPLFHPSTPSHMSLSFPKQDTPIPARVPFSAPLPVVSEGGIKLFGISLTEHPVGKANHSQDVQASDGAFLNASVPLRLPDVQAVETAKVDANSDQERVDHSSEAETRSMPSTRSCIKVMKKGSMVGRGLDLSRFDGYGSLFEELESMFNMKGELTDPSKGWQVAYSDREGDTMKVGDDPWLEFCNMVRKLYIISPEEMQGASQ